MNIAEAMQCMIDGLKVRKKSWKDCDYIHIDPCTGCIQDCEGAYYPIRSFDDSDDWELYKDKVVREEYMVSDGAGGFIYAHTSEDDDNFLTIRMEVENEYNDYDKLTIELYKEEELKDLINMLIKLL